MRHVGRCAIGFYIVCSLVACTGFKPVPLDELDYLQRAETQERDGLKVTVSVLTREESRQAFGKKLDQRFIQPVWIGIENHTGRDFRMLQHGLDPDYFSAREAAYVSHGVDTASNRGIDEYFDTLGIDPFVSAGATTSGFVFSNLKLGTKEVRVRLFGDHELQDFDFYVTVPGLRADWQRMDFESLYAPDEWTELDELNELHRWIEAFGCCTTKKDGTGSGDPVNLVVVGSLRTLQSFIKAGWDETEIISAGSSWRTFKSFITGGEYKYSPISALYVFGRPQDIGLQKARDTINERNHLRLWLSPVRFRGQPVWMGAISRDIGVFFTTRAWNLTTHAIDPEVDEARDYLAEDLATAQTLAEIGIAGGVGVVPREAPKHNLLGSPWWTDGQRTVLWLTGNPVPIEKLEWTDWGNRAGDGQ